MAHGQSTKVISMFKRMWTSRLSIKYCVSLLSGQESMELVSASRGVPAGCKLRQDQGARLHFDRAVLPVADPSASPRQKERESEQEGVREEEREKERERKRGSGRER